MNIKLVLKTAVYSLLVVLLYLLIVGVASIRYLDINGNKYDRSAYSVTLLSDTDLKDNSNYSFLSEFKRLETLDISDLDISNEGYQNIASIVPKNVHIIRNVQIGSYQYPSDIEQLTVTDDMIANVTDLSDTFSYFDSLRAVTANDIKSPDKLYDIVQTIKAINPEAKITCSTAYKGIKIDGSTEELILNYKSLKTTETIEKIVELFPNIKKIEMCDCGISDEAMAALREKYPSVNFVWMLHFLKYDVRTDVQVFSTLVSEWVANADEKTFAPLFKYCTELRALDLGHWDYISDISEIRNLKKLEILIISDNCFSDITPLAELKHLKYMDIRYNKITDVSPLTELKELQFLEVGGNPLKNAEVLCACKTLKYLYIEDANIPAETVETLKAGLPEDCEFKMHNTRGHHWYKRIIAMFRRWPEVKEYHDWENVEYYN